MNALNSILKFLGETLGANPNTLTTTSKTLVGSINEVDAKAHPVGSCVITTTNTDPSLTLGGNWTLIDKRFSQANGTNGITWNETNTRDNDNNTPPTNPRTFDWVREDHTIWLRFRWYNKVAYSDDDMTIATVDMTALGIKEAGYYQWTAAQCDAINGVLLTSAIWNDLTVTLTVRDAVTRTATVPSTTNAATYMAIPMYFYPNHMDDSACDQFVWKRTA